VVAFKQKNKMKIIGFSKTFFSEMTQNLISFGCVRHGCLNMALKDFSAIKTNSFISNKLIIIALLSDEISSTYI
jgi:hypothetical protein